MVDSIGPKGTPAPDSTARQMVAGEPTQKFWNLVETAGVAGTSMARVIMPTMADMKGWQDAIKLGLDAAVPVAQIATQLATGGLQQLKSSQFVSQ